MIAPGFNFDLMDKIVFAGLPALLIIEWRLRTMRGRELHPFERVMYAIGIFGWLCELIVIVLKLLGRIP